MFSVRDQQRPPMLGLAHLEGAQRKAVAGQMLLRDGVPAAVLDGHPRFLADGFEADVDACLLLRRERDLAPGEAEPIARRPMGDAADLKDVAVGKRGYEAAILTRLETEFAIATRRQLEKLIWAPPKANVINESVEAIARTGGYAERDDDGGRHFRFFSTWALNDAS